MKKTLGIIFFTVGILAVGAGIVVFAIKRPLDFWWTDVYFWLSCGFLVLGLVLLVIGSSLLGRLRNKPIIEPAEGYQAGKKVNCSKCKKQFLFLCPKCSGDVKIIKDEGLCCTKGGCGWSAAKTFTTHADCPHCNYRNKLI